MSALEMFIGQMSVGKILAGQVVIDQRTFSHLIVIRKNLSNRQLFLA
jgi:hypothetical protein